ncbi:choice-of-anchor I family protein [Subsaxibacter sp. CAU 1640]|uniref:choice-of-anchor I family protein n=1 Tax=Subsaxibacter sp. CAU 1640 TaxID=2933271 RepID=UPI0020050930|nr:choice-of-anchor I family protein [Subsaxibacter sp. CAU 1640]MCK7590570.1 choice-of-anchor I family protein [Subsaxibacter sp. CAU 1640]
MKKLLLLKILLITNVICAQLNIGDMAFVSFNADGDDDFAMVTFVDIPANTTIYFTDSEWNGTAFGTDENDFSWETGASIIPAGTVITFYTISATPNVSVGTIVGSPGGISTGSEAIFAFLGTAPRVPTTFIAAVANATGAFGDLSGTGLTNGTTAITYSPDGVDIAQYNGPRTGLDANGYLIALNNMTYYNIQDTGNDDHNDGIAPDVPFNTTPFVISANDTTAPSVATTIVTSATTLDVIFSESVTEVSAEEMSNYSIAPALSISSIVYNDATLTATVTHSGFANGIAYQLSVSNIEDLEANVQNPAYTSDDLFWNTTTSGLIISEIMYNAPSDDSNALEFLEIYNNSGASIDLGGIQVKDESNFTFIFPEMMLANEGIVLLATDKTTADAFYGVSFLDMPQGISNALGNGGEVLQILNSANTLIFEMEYSDDAPWPTAADGDGPSLELLNPNGDFNDGTNWTPATNLVGQSLGEDVFASPGSYVPVTNTTPQVSFASAYYNVSEDAMSLNVAVELSSIYSSDVTVDVSLVNELLTASSTTDFTFANQTITISANTLSAQIDIPILDDMMAEADEIFILQLSNPTNANMGSFEQTGVYIIDNDTELFFPTDGLDINYATSYLVDASGSAEITAYDTVSQRLFVMNSVGKKLEILDFSDIQAISTINTIDLASYGTEGPTSVTVKDGFVAVSVSNGPTADGVVVFMDINGANISSVTVGNLPDMLTFTPDGTKILVANEGQPNADYSIDPEGTISVIDVTAGFGNVTQSDVTSINFNAFDSQIASLRAANVRIFGPGASVSQDLEPEYITVSADSQTAWVTLQENNAVGVIDLTTNTITNIIPLGLKDHSLPGNTLDASDDTDFIFMANWPVFGMYMPDAIANYTNGGTTYLVMANEGDAREYDTFEEEERVSDLPLDPTVFQNADLLQLDSNLGRLTVTTATGDTDNDGLFEEIHVLGSRSFSIYNANTGTQVYDSGDDFERYTAADPTYGTLFNASNSNNNFKNRSDNKGPEPEGITVAQIGDEVYAFITLERVGGLMAYKITDPFNPTFEKYVNNRDLGENEGGDLGPEGIIYLSPEDSPTDTALIVMSNEVSSTISVYTIDNVTLSIPEVIANNNTFKVYPNPAKSNQTLYFNQEANVALYDLQGRAILSQNNVMNITLPTLSTGTYFLKNNKGETHKIIVD